MIFGPRIERRVVHDIPMAPKDEWLARVAMATPQICSRFGEADRTWNETHVPYRERTQGGSREGRTHVQGLIPGIRLSRGLLDCF